MKKTRTRAAGLVLSLVLALSLLPFGAFAADLGAASLDLTAGSKSLTGEDGAPLVVTLQQAVSQGTATRTNIQNTAELRKDHFDLNKDGKQDLEVNIGTKKLGKETLRVTQFVVLPGTTVYGDCKLTVTVPASKTGYSTLTIKFPLKEATLPKIIDTIEITSVNTDLKAGQKPVFAAVLSTESAAMATVKEEHWIDETDNHLLSSDGSAWTVEEGHTYSYGITLAAKDGYVFDDTTGLKYNGLNYPQSTIGATVKAGGSGLELWDFLPQVDVIGDAIEELTVDLTNGGTILAGPRREAMDHSLTGADAAGQLGYSGGSVDLDLDGTPDFSFDKSSGVVKLQPTLSLELDEVLTLSDQALAYVAEKHLTPYAKALYIKMAPPYKFLEVDVSAGKVTLSGSDADALVFALKALDGKGIALTTGVNNWDADLDTNGSKDLRVTEAGADVTAEALGTNSIAQGADFFLPLYDLVLQAGGGQPYVSRLAVKFKESVPATDLGALTIDLSKESAVTLDQPTFEAFQATAGGLNLTHRLKSVADGDYVKYDLDLDGRYDLLAEKKADGSGVLTVPETRSTALMGTAKTLTVDDTALSVINASGKSAYYKTVTVRFPGTRVNPFVDVQESDLFYDAVLWAYYATPQVTVGVDETHFGPDKTVTRGQTVTFLWRAAGCPEPATATNPFADVSASEYWYKPILWAVEKGITVGTDATHFTPNQTCSTAHIITFLYRALGVGDNGWYEIAAAWANGKGLLDGLALTVAPGVPCPRADVVLFLYRALGT